MTMEELEPRPQPAPAPAPNVLKFKDQASNCDVCKKDSCPTLRLRLPAGETSTSTATRQTRQAVTQPRRMSTPPPTTLPTQTLVGSASSDVGDGSDFWLATQHFESSSEQLLTTTTTTQTPQSASTPTPTQPKREEQTIVAEHRLTFEQWLQLKRRQEAQRRRQSRREAHRALQLKQLRQQLSQQSYAEWLLAKRRPQAAPRVPVELAAAAQQRCEQTQRCLADWQRRKQHELQQRRDQRQRDELEQRVDEQLRRQLSELAWQRWLAQLDARGQTTPTPTSPLSPLSPLSLLSSSPLRSFAAKSALSAQQQRRLQQQVASLYLHVPLSTAQRALRRRLDSLDAVEMQRRRRN